MGERLVQLLEQLEDQGFVTSYVVWDDEAEIVIGLNVIRLDLRRALAFARGVLASMANPHAYFAIPPKSTSR